jgi:hypothetical protein
VSLVVHEHEGQARPRCPYCHADLGREALWTCPGCATLYHQDCARENGRCAVLGCLRATPEAEPRPAPPPPVLYRPYHARLSGLEPRAVAAAASALFGIAMGGLAFYAAAQSARDSTSLCLLGSALIVLSTVFGVTRFLDR